MSVDGSRGTITFTANRDWTISTSDSWITVSPKAGEASKDPVSVTVSCSANTTYDDRTATVTIRMDELMQTVTIRQPANLGIILPTKSYNLESGANTFNVEVQANVPYSVSSSVDWIRQTGTKALTSTTYTFSVEENATYDDREGTVTIKSQNSSVADQVITVKQAQKDALIVQDKIFNMPYGGGEIEFKVEANVDFEVTPGEDWIHHVETKALSSSTVRLTVDENPTYSKREGKIEIKQKNGSLSHTITVKQAERIAVTSVTLDKTSLKLKEGETATLVATVKPDNATDKAVTWSSSNSEIATVDEAGNVFAQKEGSAKITAQAGEKTATCEVTVYKEIPVSSIELDKTTLSLAAGDAVTLKATVKPDDATDKTITWSSNDTNIAKVDTDGTVSAIGKGSTIITAYSGNVSASCKVFVKAASYPTPSGAVDLGLSVVWADKNLGASSSYDAGGYYLWGDPTGNGTIMFFDTPSTNYISDTQYDIARAKLGKGWRLPTRDEIKELLSSCTFETVSNGVRLTGPSGKSIVLPLTGMAFPSDGPAGTTSLMSKDKGFMMTGEAVLEGGGRFAFVYNYSQNSSYNLTSYNASMAKFPVRPVYELLVDYVPLSSILLNKNELVLMEGESETLTATVKPDNATDKAVNWYSSDVSVVFVDVNGIVTAMGEGTATVKAKQGAVASAPCSVTVKKKEVAVTEISLNKANLELAIGDSETLVATIKPEDATETVTWFSSDASVAAVDENGKVTAINTGTAAIIARVGEYTAACAVTVHAATIQEGNITFADATLKRKLVELYDSDGDGELSFKEAAAVTTLEKISYTLGITSFNEFRYFIGVKEIPDLAFYKNRKLKSIILPEGLTSIGIDAFCECEALTYISLPESLTKIGGGAFMDCSSLTSISLSDNVTSIEGNAFANTSLSSFTFPSKITSISRCMFYGCKKLTTLTIPDSITSIGVAAFCGSGLESVEIPTSVKQIGEQAFLGTSLKKIVLPSGISSIKTGTFESCKQLESITIPDSVTTIEQDAFSRCSALASISIPNNVSIIGIYAFYGCTSLKSITIPVKLKTIYSYAFSACSGLEEIVLKSTNPPAIGSECFSDTNNCPIKVPAESVDNYKTAKTWITYSDRIIANQ